jgi:environmental stress-induced protein Ves
MHPHIHHASPADAWAATRDALRRAGRTARLHVRLQYLRMLLASATYDQHHHANEAQRAAFRGEASMHDLLAAQAASDRFVAQRLRVEIARVEAALWPVRGLA